GIAADETIRLPRRDGTRNFPRARWRDQDIAAAAQGRAAAAERPDDEASPEDDELRRGAGQVRAGERPMP
ncbi:hypothetical protein, partial [Curtobacterium sp. PsM8]|uniref:hypothetical protein n=1 Tax=Curtobacterium sp. PsM8 TaxID=3030532 RepID=UPI00263A71F7